MNADTGGPDPQGRAHQALADAVNDYGPRILSEPALLRNQLSDVLPDEPREGSLLVAAVEVGAAAQLREQVAAVGPDAAVEAVSRNMAQTRALDPAASRWAVAEIARAMGYPVSAGPAAAPPPGEATLPWTGPAALVEPPGPPPPGAPPAVPPAYVPPPMPAAFVLPPAPGAYPPPPAPAGFAAPLPVAGPPAGPFGPAAYGGPPLPPTSPPTGSFGPAGYGGPPPPPAGPPPGPPGPGAPGGPPGPPGSGGPVGLPPAWAPPPPPPGGGNRMPLIAGAVVIVLVAGYIGLAAAAKLPPFKATATPTSTPVAACPTGEQLQAGQCVPKTTATPSAAPTHSATPTATAAPTPSAAPTATSSLTPLANILPSYITGDSTDDICTNEPSSSYVTAGATDEELCDMSANQDVPEDYILYVGFPAETPTTSYFTSLLGGNGMKAGQGDCSSLSLATAADGSSQYCEGPYTTSGSGGTDFVFTGNNDFDLGSSTMVSGLDECDGSTSIDVVGFTDPSYAAVGVALDCEGGEYSDIYDDFTAGDLFLGS